MATYSDGFRKRISLKIAEKHKKISEISREYNIDPNTLRNWVKKYHGTVKSDRLKPKERWKSHSEMLSILKKDVKDDAITLNKVISFHNKLTKACGGYDFLCKESVKKDKADQFIEIYPDLYKFYKESSLLKKISEEEKGLNYVESPAVYTQIILQYAIRFNLNPYILKVSDLFFECALKTNLFMKKTQQDGLSILENHSNLNSEELKERIFKRMEDRNKIGVNGNGRKILNTTEISDFEKLFLLKYEKYPEDVDIQNLLEGDYFTIRAEIYLRLYFQYYRLIFLINLERQEESLELNLVKFKENFENIDDIIIRLKSINKNTIRNIVSEILYKEDYKKIESETRKVQRFVKETFEDFKTTFPDVVQMYKTENDMLKAYVLLYIHKDKKPKDEKRKDKTPEDMPMLRKIEYTKSRYDKILKKHLAGGEITPEERKYITNDLNAISYYFFNKELHIAIMEIERNANLTFFRLFNDDLIFKGKIGSLLSTEEISGIESFCNN